MDGKEKMIKYKNIFKILIFLIYILVNINFYNSVYLDESNFYLLKSSLFLLVGEILFWIVFLGELLNSEKLQIKKIEKRIILLFFITVVLGIAICRVFLNSSEYFNDLLNVDVFLMLVVGIFRICYIFFSILGIVLAFSSKEVIYILITILNFIVSILIWVDFDSNITSIMRIVMGVFAILSIIFIKKVQQNTIQDTSNENIEKEEIIKDDKK